MLSALGSSKGNGDFFGVILLLTFSPTLPLKKKSGDSFPGWGRGSLCHWLSFVCLFMRPSNVRMWSGLSSRCRWTSPGLQTLPLGPGRPLCSPSGLGRGCLIDVGSSCSHCNYLKGFPKRENKLNQTITVVSHSGVKCIF